MAHDKDDGGDDDELPDAIGYMFTHYDCPLCGESDEAEGDVKGEVMVCKNCNARFKIK